FKPGFSTRYSRHDNNFFFFFYDMDEDNDKDGGLHGVFKSMSEDNDGFIPSRVKQSKRPRVSSGGQSAIAGPFLDIDEPLENDFDDMSMDQKLSLILSKLSVNENRVSSIQNKMDTMLNLKSRVGVVENVIKSQHERLKLLEYRSIDLEARSRRKNLLFKGIPEKRQENCFNEVRKLIGEELGIQRDMYLERAHRLGRYNSNKTRPIIVAFRDFCDTLDILDASSSLKGTTYGVSRDYPVEISTARQSLWKQYKTTREANPKSKVTMEFPARICVEWVVIADAFSDWYPILQGSRISFAPQNQSSDKTVNNISVTTGSTSNTAISSPRDIPITNVSSMGQLGDPVSHDHVNITDSQSSTQQDCSQERMEENGPSSPSILDKADPVVPVYKSAEAVTEPPLPQRGRSLDRKLGTSVRPRQQSSSNSRTRIKLRGSSRSISRCSQSSEVLDFTQATGGGNFKKPDPKTSKNSDKVESQRPIEMHNNQSLA
ncbi:MAG: hypothetical protein N0E48_15590, partial [Candidatus Thiodiazotropha endolucinida]|nr:hypothetical protein [Candidatus Thiodiazotropha taylori]MCW4344757.1 hypothetical protein [Candidatus Thiodiazotropha endolucinida]